MQKDTRKKKWAYKSAMLLKYWKAARKEPIMDLCMIIAMYAQDIETGLLYAVGWSAGLTINNDELFTSIDTLSHITLQDKDGKEALVKGVMNGIGTFHAFLLENRIVRVIKKDKFISDITLELEVIKMNSGNHCDFLFVVDTKMHVYEIKDGGSTRVTGLPDGLKIKDISCTNVFTVFLSECGRVFGMGWNKNDRLGLTRKIEETEIPTEIIFPNQSDSDKNRTIITMIYASQYGWVAVDYKQRAWVVGEWPMQSVRSDYRSLDPCISIIEVWHSNNIRITQIECGEQHVIALDTEGRVYWFGKFFMDSLSSVSLDPVPFSHRITDIRSGYSSVACKDATNEWYVWGWNLSNHITGLCGCKTVCKKTENDDIISNPMRCEWQGLFNATRVINLQLGYFKAHVIVNAI